MLDVYDENEMISQLRDQLPCRIELPEEWDDFFALSGVSDPKFDDRRRFSRRRHRRKAILERNDVFFTVYTKDVSRIGIGLLHPEQLFPGERVKIWLPGKLRFALRVTRCLRIQKRCYECGTNFDIQRR